MPEDDESGKGEDRSGRNCLARRCDGLHDVVLENRGVAEDPQYCHRDDCGRNARRHGKPGIQPQVSVRGTKEERERDPKYDCAFSEFARSCVYGRLHRATIRDCEETSAKGREASYKLPEAAPW